MTAPRPKQPPCNCRLRTFPHREDQFCRQLREDEAYRPGDNQDDCQAWHDFEAKQFDREQGRCR